MHTMQRIRGSHDLSPPPPLGQYTAAGSAENHANWETFTPWEESTLTSRRIASSSKKRHISAPALDAQSLQPKINSIVSSWCRPRLPPAAKLSVAPDSPHVILRNYITHPFRLSREHPSQPTKICNSKKKQLKDRQASPRTALRNAPLVLPCPGRKKASQKARSCIDFSL